MAQCWEPGTQYNNGDVVAFEGHDYKIIQPHRSQSDWTPSITPALWGRMQGHSQGGNNNNQGHNYGGAMNTGVHHDNKPQQQQQHQGQNQDQGQNQNQGQNNSHGYGGGNNQQGQPGQAQLPQGGTYNKPQGQEVEIQKEEEKKSWYDLDDDRKKQLQVGGGLLAGVAALGAGYMVYKKHEDKEEAEKAQAWGLQSWLRESERRTQTFFQTGPTGPTTWILAQGKNIPKDAIVGGEENGNAFYIGRAFLDGGLQIGKASTNSQKGASIGYSNKNYELETYEVLIGNQSALRWVEVNGDFSPENLGVRPVEGGRENNGAILWVAKAFYKTGTHPGKTGPGYKCAYVVYGSNEEKVKEYSVLCYA